MRSGFLYKLTSTNETDYKGESVYRFTPLDKEWSEKL